MNKTKFILSILLIFAVFTSFIIKTIPDAPVEQKIDISPVPPGPNNGQTFLYGAIQYLRECNFNNYDVLGFNMYHHYVGGTFDNTLQRNVPYRVYPWITCWPQNDGLLNGVSEYASDVLGKLNDIKLHNNSKVLWQRPKIEWLAYGQRSDYQCEEVPGTDQLWFYAFNSDQPGHTHIGTDINDYSQYGNGVRVKRCLISEGPNNGGYVVDRLKANSEQCRRELNSNLIFTGICRVKGNSIC